MDEAGQPGVTADQSEAARAQADLLASLRVTRAGLDRSGPTPIWRGPVRASQPVPSALTGDTIESSMVGIAVADHARPPRVVESRVVDADVIDEYTDSVPTYTPLTMDPRGATGEWAIPHPRPASEPEEPPSPRPRGMFEPVTPIRDDDPLTQPLTDADFASTPLAEGMPVYREDDDDDDVRLSPADFADEVTPLFVNEPSHPPAAETPPPRNGFAVPAARPATRIDLRRDPRPDPRPDPAPEVRAEARVEARPAPAGAERHQRDVFDTPVNGRDAAAYSRDHEGVREGPRDGRGPGEPPLPANPGPVPPPPVPAPPAGARPVSTPPAGASDGHPPGSPWRPPEPARPWAPPSGPRPATPILPHRVPAPPDVPDVYDDGSGEADDLDYPTGQNPADPDGPELTRIASGLREVDRRSVPEELDVEAVLQAVRRVAGVRGAELRPNPGGVHTLRLDLADGADAGWVSRQVARVLKERMGLAAEPRRRTAGQSVPVGDAPGRGVRTAPDAARPDPARPGLAPTSIPMQPTVPTLSSSPYHPAGGPDAPNGTLSRPTEPRRPTSLADYAPAGTSRSHRTDQLEASSAARAVRGRELAATRVILEQVHVATVGTEATVEVRLRSGGIPAVGTASGPAVDTYLLRLAAQSTAEAVDAMAVASGRPSEVRCFIDHANVVPFGGCQVAVVVVLLSGEGWVEQVVGSALVAGDPRHAIARATLDAVNRRLEWLMT